MDNNTYGCERCGEPHDWDALIWISPQVGICEECYKKYATKETCACCGNTLFISEKRGQLYYCYECDEHVPFIPGKW